MQGPGGDLRPMVPRLLQLLNREPAVENVVEPESCCGAIRPKNDQSSPYKNNKRIVASPELSNPLLSGDNNKWVKQENNKQQTKTIASNDGSRLSEEAKTTTAREQNFYSE